MKKDCRKCAFKKDFGYGGELFMCEFSQTWVIHPIAQAAFCQMYRPQKEEEKK